MSDHPHIFELFDPSEYVQAFELDGKDVTVTIDRVVGGVVEGDGGKKSKKPIAYLSDWPKPLVLNKTNSRVLIKFFGENYTRWGGKRITIYPTTTKLGRETVECVRIREQKPPQTAQQRPAEPLAERAAKLKAALKGARTKEQLDSLWLHSKAAAIRSELDAEEMKAELLDLDSTYTLRGEELDTPV